MAKVKAGGTTIQHPQGKRKGKRLGVKLFGGQKVKTGQIIVRQRGAKFHAGTNAKLGKDFTLFAMANGEIKFRKKHGIQYIDVISL